MDSMHRASDLRTGGLRRGALVVAGLAIALLLASLLSWRLGAPTSPAEAVDGAPGLWPLALAWLALALVMAAVSALAGASWARQRADRELRAARLDRQALVELLDVWQWQTDDEHRLLRLSPPATASSAAWSAEPEPRAPAWERFDAGTPPPGPLRERLCARISIVDLSVTRREVDGTTGRWLLRGVPRFDGRGRFIGYLGTARPLQAGREASATPSARVEEGSSDAAREQESFSYTVSHDLRAPLRVVDGFARILKEDYGGVLDKIGHDHLDRVLGAAARMNHMIDALLNLSQLSSRPLARQPVNLSQLAGFVVDDLRRSAPERSVDVHIEPGMTTQGDPTLLRMALENLLGNAWKYTARTAEPRIGFERTEHDGGFAYTVHDNGAGFDMRFADRLFGVFQRLHSASEFEGTGVGLASVRRIVQRHHGEIWAESEVGRGARFHFTLRA
jgi:signal transduction histidine kinase